MTAEPAKQASLPPPRLLRLLRVFLASPGDVADERGLALRVLNRLQYDPFLRGQVVFEAVAWDHPDGGSPMLAGISAQDSVVLTLGKPSECDIVVLILWARLGSPIAQPEYAKPDGEGFYTGTEWEYTDALQGFIQTGGRIPQILMYRRQGERKIGIDASTNEQALLDQLAQAKAVDAFFQACHARNGSIPNPYAESSDFEKALEQHLKTVVKPMLSALQPVASSVGVQPIPLWSGSPFPGLRAFTDRDAPIFFGRGRETDGLIAKLRDAQVRFLAVVGASGSGKSSLVWAGLIPRLQSGAFPGSSHWRWVRFTPGEVSDDPFQALAQGLKPLLGEQGQVPREVANQLRKKAEELPRLVQAVLTDGPAGAELLLFIDQLEELFTVVAPDARAPFITLLAQAAAIPRLRIVATLRADLYYRCVERPLLAELLKNGSYPLAAPGAGALHEMIVRPADRAGLTFAEGLVQQILDDTGTEPGALALLAFALAELYQSRTAAGDLTSAAYDGFGGVDGAIGQRAEGIWGSLGMSDDTFGEVFQELVDVESGGAVARRRALWQKFESSPNAARLVQAFVAARLLVATRNEGEKPVVEVAHEALFTAWKRLRDWIKQQHERLRAAKDLEETAEEWRDIGERWSGLASGTRLRRYLQALKPSPLAARFLKASRLRRRILWTSATTLATVGLPLLAGALWLYAQGLTLRHGTAMALSALGLYQVAEPEMIEIPTGKFLMGAADDEPDAQDSERPRHRVTIERFALGKYEVTFEDYDRFALATGRPLPSDQNYGRGRRPVINVSWDDARAYTAWLSKKTNKAYRLPTEAEWEYAARAETETARYWGDASACEYANGADRRFHEKYGGETFPCDDGFAETAEVGRFKANGFGLHDLLGNVWEWVEDGWHATYEGAPADGSAREAEGDATRVARGGSWRFGAAILRSARRNRNNPDARFSGLGFRLAMTP